MLSLTLLVLTLDIGKSRRMNGLDLILQVSIVSDRICG